MGSFQHDTLHRAAVRIPADGLLLDGELEVPARAKGLVIFAHGTGSGRLSPRNIMVAQRLRVHSLATLLVDLLSEDEEQDAEKRFDIDLLTERLTAVTDWARHDQLTGSLSFGYFGASTGAAAALTAAAYSDGDISAIVSRGGRVDLAGVPLKDVAVPTLLIVGQNDFGVLEVNEEAFLRLNGKKELSVIPRATHLFEEPGALERVAILAAEWFNEYLGNGTDGTTNAGRIRSGDTP